MLTDKFIEKIFSIKEDDIPEEVYQKAQLHVMDYLGVSYGSKGFDDNNDKVYQLIKKISKKGNSKLIDREDFLTAPFTAFYNATVNHTIEMDDTNSEASLHPASVIISVALACGYETHCTGRRFLFSIIMGYEVMIRLGKTLNPATHYAKGFHPTATCGTFGSSITAAILYDLNLLEFKSAFGLAGSYVSGNSKYQTEASIAKRLQPAIAAQNGTFATLEAKEGLVGPKTILEEYNGFFESYSDNSNVTVLFNKLGEEFQIMKTGLKLYPCCRYIHGPIDGIKAIMTTYKLKYTDIKKVNIEVTEAAVPIVVEPAEKKRNTVNTFDRQFSLYYCAGLTLAVGDFSYDIFVNTNIKEDIVKEQIDKIYIVHNAELDELYPEYWATNVSIITNDDKTYTIRVNSCSGELDKFILEDINRKFITLASKAMKLEDVISIREAALTLLKRDSIEGLFYKNSCT